MHKRGQSLLDFINVFPLQSIQVSRSPISNKEASALLDIWNCAKDEYGNKIITDNIDPTIVAALTSKGMVKNKLNGLTIGNKKILEITKKGKEIIRNIILQSETSAFEKSSKIDYESIHRLLDNPMSKSASKINQETPNWLQKVLWKSF